MNMPRHGAGLVDGLFGDKWSKGAQAHAGNCSGDMCICNHECGSMSASQGAAWNEGKAEAWALPSLASDWGFGHGSLYTAWVLYTAASAACATCSAPRVSENARAWS